MKQPLRLSIIFFPPLAVFVFVFFSSTYYLKIPALNTSFGTQTDSVHQITNEETHDIRPLLFSALDISFAELQYKACVINQNRETILIDQDRLDLHSLFPHMTMGAMEIKFLRKDNQQPHSIFTRSGFSDCKILTHDDLSSRQVLIQQHHAKFETSLGKNATGTSHIDSFGSKMYARFTVTHTLLIFSVFLITWWSSLLLLSGIVSFVRFGFKERTLEKRKTEKLAHGKTRKRKTVSP